MLNQPIVIAGGGIAGLTLALALLRRGIPVTVHEQVASPAEVGAGLQLSANGTRCLFSLGLGPSLRAIASEPQGKEVRLWNTGQRWKLFDLGAASEASYGYPYLMVHRGDLHQLLLGAVRSLDAFAVRTSRRCVGFQQHDDRVEVKFSDGRQESAAALIGADGVHSQVRAQLFGAGNPDFTGCVAWRGLVPRSRLPSDLMLPVGSNWIGPGAHVVTYPLRGGELMNFVGIVERDDWRVESWTEAGTTSECAADFAGWHADVQTLIAGIDKPYKWALVGRKPLDTWTSGRVTLMGDAAHPTLPFLAQGANMAIEDALVAARCIELFKDDLPTALRRYERTRMARTSRIVLGSMENGRRFHNPALSDPDGAQAYVSQQWAEDEVRQRYHWLFEYDALTVPLAEAHSVAG